MMGLVGAALADDSGPGRAVVDPATPALPLEPCAWVEMGREDTARPSGDAINAVVVSPSTGALWVASSGGLSRLHDGGFKHFTAVNGLPDGPVFSVAATQAGVAAATKDGLYWIDDSSPEQVRARRLVAGFVPSVVRVGDALFYAVVRQGEAGALQSWPLDGLEAARTGDARREIKTPGIDVRSLPSASGGAILLETRGRSRVLFHPGEPPPSEGWCAGPPALLALGADTVALTSGRPTLWPPHGCAGVAESAVSSAALPDDPGTLGPARDLREFLWAREGELDRFRVEQGAIHPVKRLRLPDRNRPSALAEDLIGRLWVGTDHGLLMADPARIEVVPEASSAGAEARPRRAAGFTADGRVWTGDRERFAVVYPRGDSIPYPPIEGTVSGAHVDRQVIVATDAGLFRFDPTGWTALDRIPDASPGGRRLAVAMDPRPRVGFDADRDRLHRLELDNALLDRVVADRQINEAVRARHSMDELKRLEQENNLLTRLEPEIGIERLSRLVRRSSREIAAVSDGTVVMAVRPAEGEVGEVHARLFVADRQPVDLPMGPRGNVTRSAVGSGARATVLSNRGLLELTPELTLRPLPGPTRNGQSSLDALVPAHDGGALYVGDREVFRQDDRMWRSEIALEPPQAARRWRTGTVTALLPDESGGGFHALCQGCFATPSALFHLADSGRIELVELPVDDPVVAMLRGAKGALWVTTGHELFTRPPGPRARFVKVKEIPGRVAAMVADRSGRPWLGIEGKRVVALKADGGDNPAVEHEIRLAAAPAAGDPAVLAFASDRVWVGGRELCTSIDPATGKEQNRIAPVRRALGNPAAVTVSGFVEDQKGVLVLTDHGLVVLSPEGAAPVPLPGFSEGDREARIARLSDRSVVVTASSESTTRRWIRSADDLAFRRPDELSFGVRALAAGPNGRAIFAGDGETVLALDGGDRVGGLWTLPSFDPSRTLAEPPSGGIRSVCPLGPTRALVLAGPPLPYVLDTPYPPPAKAPVAAANAAAANAAAAPPAAGPRPVRLLLPRWTQCQSTSPTQALLLTASGVSLATVGDAPSHVPAPFEGEPVPGVHRPSAFARCPGDEAPFVLDERGIFRWQGSEFHRVLPLPPGIGDQPEPLSFALDASTAWVGTNGRGLWRARWACASAGPPGVGGEVWEPWDDRDGIPARSIDAILPRPDGGAVVFTPGGNVLASPARDGRLEIKPLFQLSIAGSQIGSGALFELGGRKVLALGTEEGVNLIAWDAAAGGPEPTQPWLLVDASAGLAGGGVAAVRWQAGRLWVATAQGISVLRLRASSSRVASLAPPEREESVTAADGLPPGSVTEMAVAPDGRNAWVLVRGGGGYRVARWERGRQRVVSSEPILLASSKAIHLGPSIGGRAPSVIVREGDAGWSIRRFGILDAPRLEVIDRLFWINGELRLQSVDPELEDPAGWDVRYAIDTLDGEGSPGASFLPPALWRPGPHRMIASIIRRSTGDRYRAVAIVEAAPVERVILLLIIGLVGLSVVGGGSFATVRTVRRLRAIRANLIPYVEGAAILDPNQFFGRKKLLLMLRDSIVQASFALVGDFRIGKTSIQHQLGQILETTTHPHHVFLPVFVDLQLLGKGGGDEFFHFLGGHLVAMARKHGCPDAVIAELEHPACTERDAYDATALITDLEAVIAHFKKKLAPLRKEPVIVFQIDELAVMEGFEPYTRNAFRSVFVSRPLVKAVLSGPRLLRDPEADQLSPWWNFLKTIEIEPLTPDEARELIVTPARGLFEFDEPVIQRIIARSEGRPLAIQALCANVVRYKYASGTARRRRITARDLEAALHAAPQPGPEAGRAEEKRSA